MCLVVAFFSLCSCEEKIYTHGEYEITIYSSCIKNDSVGRDWVKTYTCNGKSIASGERFILPLDVVETITIDATIKEMDKWPDVGRGSLSVDLQDGATATTKIRVVENKGRYKRHSAEWEVVCSVELVEKLCQGEK